MGKMNGKYNQQRQEFLLTFFSEQGYEVKEVNGWTLVKSLNGQTHRHQVSIYPPGAYERSQKEYKKIKQSRFEEVDGTTHHYF